MAKDAPAVNGHENHDNIKADKPTVVAKEPAVAKPMVYEPGPIRIPNGLSNGTTNYSMSQREAISFQLTLQLHC